MGVTTDSAASLRSPLELGVPVDERSLLEQSTPRSKLIFFVLAALALGLRIATLICLQGTMTVGVSLVTLGRRITLMEVSMADNYFGETMGDMYAAGAYGTLVLIVCGTAIIPLSRLLAIVFCYIIPFKSRYHSLRSNLVFMLDHVGRFILADQFMEGYTTYVFFMNKHLVNNDEAPVHDLTLTLGNTYEYIYYALLGSNILGTLLTHKVLLMLRPNYSKIGESSSKVVKQRIFARVNEDSLSRFVFFVSCSAGLCALVDLLIVQSDIVTFQLSGVAGLVTDAEPRTFDIWRPVLSYRNCIYPSGHWWKDNLVYILSVVHLICIIILPVVVLGGSLLIALVPMEEKFHHLFLYYSPFWFSFCAMDVLFIVSLALYFEMNILATYLFHNKYPEMCDWLDALFHQPCTSVNTDYGRGLFSVGVVVLSIYVVRFRWIQMHDRHVARTFLNKPADAATQPLLSS